jgi:hypothetical protein
MYGRFLISAMDTSAATWIVSILVGFVEIGLRVSVYWRDSRARNLARKLTHRKRRRLEHETMRDIELYSNLASVDIVAENGSIVVSAAMLYFFAGMPAGRAVGDLAMQLVIEFVVDWVCVMVETSHGLRVVEMWQLRGGVSGDVAVVGSDSYVDDRGGNGDDNGDGSEDSNGNNTSSHITDQNKTFMLTTNSTLITPHRRFALYITGVLCLITIYMCNQIFTPGTGFWTGNARSYS